MMRLIAIVLAALSTANLLQLILPPLSPAVGHVVSGYDFILQLITETRLPGWTEPLVEYVIRALRLPEPSTPHWKHVFVLMGIYFTSVAKVVRTPNTHLNRYNHLKHQLAYPVNFSIGTLIAFGCAVMSATLPADGHFPSRQAWLPLVTSLGLLAFDLLGTLWNCSGLGYVRWHFALRGFLIAFVRAFVGLSVAIFALEFGLLSDTNNPSVASLAVIIFWLATYWLVIGAAYSGRLGGELQGLAAWQIADGMVLGPGAGLHGPEMMKLGWQMYMTVISPLALWGLSYAIGAYQLI